jgi:hypothetical protein
MSSELAPCPCVSGYFPELAPTPPPLGIWLKPRELESNRVRTHGHQREHGCRDPLDGIKRCPHCWQIKDWPEEFSGHHECNDCREGR